MKRQPNRRAVVVGGIAAFSTVATAQPRQPLKVFSADVRPLSIAAGDRRGIILDVVAKAASQIGRAAEFEFLTFADAMRRTAETPASLIAPLARTPQRESGFTWIVRIIDVPQAFGTQRSRGPANLETARQLTRIGVVRQGVQETFLTAQGFSNLMAFGTAGEIAQALAIGQIDGWYGTATEIALNLEALGRSQDFVIGPSIQAAPVWLAGNQDVTAVPVKELHDAVEQLRAEGAIESIYRQYVRL